MHEAHSACHDAPLTTQVHLRKVENGFVVEVAYPKRMLGDPVIDTFQHVMNTVAKKEAAAGDPISALNEVFADLKKPRTALRKPVEEYVFPNIEAVLTFIKETMAADTASLQQ